MEVLIVGTLNEPFTNAKRFTVPAQLSRALGSFLLRSLIGYGYCLGDEGHM